MVLVSPDFTICSLSDVKSLSLVLRTNRYGFDLIVSNTDDGMVATVLNTEHQFISFPADDARNHDGIVFDGIKIEVEIDLGAHRNLESSPLGALVRNADGLFLRCQPNEGLGRYGYLTKLVDGLPMCGDTMSAAFTKWSIVKGAGADKQILYSIDVSPEPESEGRQ